MLGATDAATAVESLQACDPSEASLVAASQFLDAVCADPQQGNRSRAATPMIVRQPPIPCAFPESEPPSPKSLHVDVQVPGELRASRR